MSSSFPAEPLHEIAVQLANLLSEDARFWLRRDYVPAGTEPVPLRFETGDRISPRGQAVLACVAGLLATPYRASRPNDYQPTPTVWSPATVVVAALAHTAHVVVRLSTESAPEGESLTFEVSSALDRNLAMGRYTIPLPAPE
ncbi:MAG: hypothetical protein ABIT01_13510 [Thermoanaerobaculia bacterium]